MKLYTVLLKSNLKKIISHADIKICQIIIKPLIINSSGTCSFKLLYNIKPRSLKVRPLFIYLHSFLMQTIQSEAEDGFSRLLIGWYQNRKGVNEKVITLLGSLL